MGRIYYSAATCSWIDPATGLPEVDASPITQLDKPRGFLRGDLGFRFSNFMEAWVEFSPQSGGATLKGFTSASGIYRGPSFAHIPSHAFATAREVFDDGDCVRFTQTVGARTASPEVIGGAVGWVAGALTFGVLGVWGPVVGAVTGTGAARQITGFPPIWTKLQIRIYRTGRARAELLQHSLFPSMTSYFPPREEAIATAYPQYFRTNHPNGHAYYDATRAVQLPYWEARGWGPMAHTTTPGPCAGNPWGTLKGATGGTENLPN